MTIGQRHLHMVGLWSSWTFRETLEAGRIGIHRNWRMQHGNQFLGVLLVIFSIYDQPIYVTLQEQEPALRTNPM